MTFLADTSVAPHRGWIAGVCAGLADRAEVPVWLVRLAAVCLLGFHAGLTLILYAALALFGPRHGRGMGARRYAVGSTQARIDALARELDNLVERARARRW